MSVKFEFILLNKKRFFINTFLFRCFIREFIKRKYCVLISKLRSIGLFHAGTTFAIPELVEERQRFGTGAALEFDLFPQFSKCPLYCIL